MIDTHCHLDLYERPTDVADRANRAGVLTVAVTNLPSAFDRANPHVRQFKNLRLALGLHPILVTQHTAERARFEELIESTSYIGEVGLDFSPEGAARDLQVESFRFVLKVLRGKQKFVTVHSRRAEAAVLDLLEEEGRSPVVFHWFSGTIAVLRRALARGHFFSINPAMAGSPNGKKIIAALPPERVLTETDGPFVQVGGRPAVPSDVGLVEEYLAAVWKVQGPEARARVRENFLGLVGSLR